VFGVDLAAAGEQGQRCSPIDTLIAEATAVLAWLQYRGVRRLA
jgi:hypothetical protein